MWGRELAFKVSLVCFLGGLLWAFHVTLFHLNSLLPPAQNVRAYHWDKLGEGYYRVEVLRESLDIKLPGEERLTAGGKELFQRIRMLQVSEQEIVAKAYAGWEDIRERGLNLARRLTGIGEDLYQLLIPQSI